MATSRVVEPVVQVVEHCNCGCGFKTDSVVLAVKHVQQSGHQLTIAGMITRSKPKTVAQLLMNRGR